MGKNLRDAYKAISADPFPKDLEIRLGTCVQRFVKRTWTLTDEQGRPEEKGLRYGENPGQPAALYELVASEAALGGADLIQPGAGLVGALSEDNLIQFGKHPGKINLTDIDSAVLMLRYLTERPTCAIMKHNNPCAVASADTAAEAVRQAYAADPLASFGGCVVLNKPLDREGAETLSNVYIEVVACPDYEAGACEALQKKKNLRIVRLPSLGALAGMRNLRHLDLRSLTDGGLIAQLSPLNTITGPQDFLPAAAAHEGAELTPKRPPTQRELDDMVFGWAVMQGVTSNSVLFARDQATVAIGAGGQDRVGVVKQAIMKAYDRLRDRLSLAQHKQLFFELELDVKRGNKDASAVTAIEDETRSRTGDLPDSVLISDAFFPRRDGVDLALEVGASAICQPGGSIRDWESIQAINEADPPAAMVFTGQRAFRH